MKQRSTCEEEIRILHELVEATKQLADAAKELRSMHGDDFKKQLQCCHDARERCALLRKELADHRSTHGCRTRN
jgi:hypothetical protein